MFLRLAVVAAAVTLLGSSQPQRPEVLVSSATVRVVRKPVDTQLVYIQNLRNARLVEWEFSLAEASNPDRPTSHGHYVRTEGQSLPGDGPIAPAETRTARLGARDASPQVARMTLVVFDDGVVDGTLAAVTEFRRKQAALAADSTAWHAALQALPVAETEGLVYLRQQRDAALRLRPDDPSRIRQQVTQWLEGSRPRGWAFGAASSVKSEAASRLSAATRYRNGADAALRSGTAMGSALASFVGVRAAAGQGLDLVAVVENLKETPLEAWELALYDGPSSRYPNSGRSTDACVVLNDQLAEQKDSGRIARGAPREMNLGPADGARDQSLPVVVLKSAIWSDLSWEGDPDAHAARLRSREQQAEQYAFWISALEEAETKASLTNAVAFLTAKREERRRLAPGEADMLADNLRIWAGRSEHTPNAKAADLAGYRRTLERQHQLLTRHLSR